MTQWIKHNGGGCPVPPDTVVAVKTKTGYAEGKAFSFIFPHLNWGLITEYRVIVLTISKEETVEPHSDIIKHDGSAKCPVHGDAIVTAYMFGGGTYYGEEAKNIPWNEIDAYKIISEVISKTEIPTRPYVIQPDGTIKQVEPTYEERLRDRVAIKALSAIIINEGCGGISTMEAQIKYALDMGEMYLSQRAARKQKEGGR